MVVKTLCCVLVVLFAVGAIVVRVRGNQGKLGNRDNRDPRR